MRILFISVSAFHSRSNYVAVFASTSRCVVSGTLGDHLESEERFLNLQIKLVKYNVEFSYYVIDFLYREDTGDF